MNIDLLKHLGNINQIAGIRVSTLRRGRGVGMDIAEFYNAAGLRFTVLPDRCMDLNDLSYKGINLSFQSKNGLISGASFESSPGSFCDEWPGGMLAIWSVAPDPKFTKRLDQSGMKVEELKARAHGGKGARHVIWVATKA